MSKSEKEITTIRVSRRTWEKIKALKYRYKFKSVDELLEVMLSSFEAFEGVEKAMGVNNLSNHIGIRLDIEPHPRKTWEKNLLEVALCSFEGNLDTVKHNE